MNDYIANKVVPLWSHGWIRAGDIRSQFLKSGKAKIKDPRRSGGESTDRTPSSKEHDANRKPAPANANSVDKPKSHGSKDAPTKASKSSSERPTVPKVERKHDKPDDSMAAVQLAPDLHVSSAAIPAASIPSTVGCNYFAANRLAHAGRATDEFHGTIPHFDLLQLPMATEAHVSSSNAHASTKSKSNSTSNTSLNSSSNNNGSAKLYSKHNDSKVSVIDITISPSKKASDHSISVLMSAQPSNHSTPLVSALKPHQQLQHHHHHHQQPPQQPQQLPQQSPASVQLPVHNNNNTSIIKTSKTSVYISPKSKTTVIELSESDDPEVIETHSPPKKAKSHKHKHNKKSKESSADRSAPHHTAPPPPPAPIPTTDLTNDEMDHNQLIHDLKVNNPPRKKHVHWQL